jgi:prepilin-type N-terminal cleavage/methylation domain-containing protein
MRGFSLIEMMIALVVLTFGLLTAGQMLFIAASSSSLARSQGAAAILAQDELESLAGVYQRDPLDLALSNGGHGPRQAEVANPVDGSILNRYNVTWDVSDVPDLRPGMRLNSKLVRVAIVPISATGAANSQPGMNKIMSVSTVLSPIAQ